MGEICIIGAGPAGLMAAIHAAMHHAPVVILEANPTAGRKLLVTGGGRCNFTHAGSPEEIAKAFDKQGRFLRHSLYEFSPDDVRQFFQSRGLPGTVEPDGCVFPAGNQATEVRDALVQEAQRLGVRIQYQIRVNEITAGEDGFTIHAEESADCRVANHPGHRGPFLAANGLDRRRIPLRRSNWAIPSCRRSRRWCL